jgi:hypothetical protein
VNVAATLLLAGLLAAGQSPDEKRPISAPPPRSEAAEQAAGEKPSPPPSDTVKGGSAKKDTAKNKASSSLDNDLLGDLTEDLFDGLERPKLADPPKKAEPAPAKEQDKQGKTAPPDDDLTGQVGEGEDLGQEHNPLLDLGQRMRRVESLIANAKTGEPTQRQQDEIIRDLDKLIEAARQQCSSCSSSSSSRKGAKDRRELKLAAQPKNGKGSGDFKPNPRPKGSDTKPREAKVAKPKTGDGTAAGQADVWGWLPEHTREAIANATSQKYLDEYDDEVKEYFLRLQELFMQQQK